MGFLKHYQVYLLKIYLFLVFAIDMFYRADFERICCSAMIAWPSRTRLSPRSSTKLSGRLLKRSKNAKLFL